MTLKELIQKKFKLPENYFSSNCSHLCILYSDKVYKWLKNSLEDPQRVVTRYYMVEGQSWYGKRFIDVPFSSMREYSQEENCTCHLSYSKEQEAQKDKFQIFLKAFIFDSQKLVEEWYGDSSDSPKLDYTSGKRYIRIDKDTPGKGLSAWAFVDKTNGNILKASGRGKPVSGKRGNILDGNALKSVNAYGVISSR